MASSTSEPKEAATPEPTVSSARVVFTTVELVALILENCATLDLLHLVRVNSTFKEIISTSKTIQQKLFFLPCEDNTTATEDFEINPFMQHLAIDKNKYVPPGCDYDWGPAARLQEDIDAGDDCDSMLGGHSADEDPIVYQEIDWDRIAADPRFMREDASWKRMLVSQPPCREVWNVYKQPGDWLSGRDAQEGRNVKRKTEGGLRLGDIWEGVHRARENVTLERLRTFVRSSERFGVVVIVNVDIKPINTDEDFDRHMKAPNIE